MVWSTARLSGQEVASPHAYLYLDAYDARFECLIPVPDLMKKLGKNLPAMLPAAMQPQVVDAARQAAQAWLEIKLDGQPVPKLALANVNLVKGVPGRTERSEPNELLIASQTMVGFTWEVDLESLPKNITVTWQGFNVSGNTLPVTVVVGSQSDSFELKPSEPSHQWNNQGRLSLRSPLAEVPLLPPPPRIPLPVGSIVWLAAGVVIMRILHLMGGGRIGSRAMLGWIVVIAGTVVLWPLFNVSVRLPRHENVTPEQGERILQALIRNIYRAFDQRNESAIYDVLERSIDGDQLQKTYLQTVQALTLDEQDKTRVRVTDLDVHVEKTEPRKEGEGFIADVRWTALGTVGHWGHEHQGVNRYRAKITVAAIKPKGPGTASDRDAWKIIHLEVLEERRL